MSGSVNCIAIMIFHGAFQGGEGLAGCAPHKCGWHFPGNEGIFAYGKKR